MRKKSLMILGMVCLFLFVSSAVRAEKLSIPACSFIPEGHHAEQLQLDTAWGDYIYRKNTTEEHFYTPVYLPHGSIIKWIQFHVIDNDPSFDLVCGIIRLNKYNATPNSIYVAFSSGSSSALRHFTDTVPSNPALTLVNNDVCNYFVCLSFDRGPSGPDRIVYGITIYYE